MGSIVCKEIYAPATYFEAIGGFTKRGFYCFASDWKLEKNEKGHYPVFQVMYILNELQKGNRQKERRVALERKFKVAREDGSGEEEKTIQITTVKDALDYEKLQEVRIKNQERLGRLIPVEVAKTRQRTSFQAVSSAIKYGIKLASVQVAVSTNARDCENIMLNAYNSALEILKEGAEDVPWEKEGASIKLGGTELADFADEGTSSDSGGEDSDSE